LVEHRIVLRDLVPAAAPGPLSLVALIVHLMGRPVRTIDTASGSNRM
jgi:hypothetical protein